MGKRTIFDMGKNRYTDWTIPPLDPPKLDPEIAVHMDRAKDAMDAMAYAMYLMTGTGYARIDWDSDPRNPRNMRAPANTAKGPVIDLRPEDYREVVERRELPGVSDVTTRGPNNQYPGASSGNNNEPGENRD